MLTGHYSRILVCLALSALLAGCTQPGPILSRQTTIGTLKTSLSHIEFENQQLRTKVASLESENREIENRYLEEEQANGDLSARLDNARNLLSDRGYNWDESDRSTPRSAPPSGGSPARTLPAGRSKGTQRKPPFARIPGQLDSQDPADRQDDGFNPPRMPSSSAFGPQSSLEDNTQWLPIANSTSPSGTTVR